MLENDQLQSTMVQNEQESIEIFTMLQQNEEKKNSQVGHNSSGSKIVRSVRIVVDPKYIYI